MKVWLGGRVFDAECQQMQLDGDIPHHITSFAGMPKKESKAMMDPSEFTFFLDSGAFSAWSRGAVIDLDEYCAFVKANIEHIEVYANLDVIPGVPGRNATKAERERAAAQSWENFLYMRSEGLDPLPIFHVGEDFKWLDMMCEATDYIGLGGMVGSHLTPDLRRGWLDSVFYRICDSEGKPAVKTHGFGMTSIPLIFRYPWYSVDSTTWIKIASHGGVLLPAVRDGEFAFDKVPETVYVSDASTKATGNNAHFNMFGPAKRAILERWLAECGKTLQQVQEHYYHRAVCSVMFFKRVSEAKLNQVFKLDRPRKQSLVA
jgi:hypothetical protein